MLERMTGECFQKRKICNEAVRDKATKEDIGRETANSLCQLFMQIPLIDFVLI